MTRVTLPTATLLEAASYLVSTANENSTQPVQSMFLMSIKDNKLRMVASSTERELSYTCELAPENSEDGLIIVPGKKLTELLKNAPPNSDATLKETENLAYQLTFSGLRSRYTLRGISADGFVTYTLAKKEIITFCIDAAAFDRSLGSVIHAAAHKDVRNSLNGVSILHKDDRLYVTATDGHRLSRFTLNLDDSATAPAINFSRILPRRTIRHIRDVLKGATGPVTCAVTNNHFAVRYGNRSLKANLIDDRYPDIDRVIPPLSQIPLQVNRQAWLSVVNRIAILANEKFRGAQLIMDKGDDAITLTATNPTNEQAQEQAALLAPAADELAIGVNIDYLRNAIEQISEQEVQIHFTDGDNALRINGANDVEHCHVIMPMRI